LGTFQYSSFHCSVFDCFPKHFSIDARKLHFELFSRVFSLPQQAVCLGRNWPRISQSEGFSFKLEPKPMKITLFSTAVLLSMVACEQEEVEEAQSPTLPDTLYSYVNPDFPDHFYTDSLGQETVIEADNMSEDNLTTDEGATLGRVLFYDKQLSANGTIACASCHKAEFGFSDDAVLSEGFEGGQTGRHSMSLTNARFYGKGKFFWDQRAKTLEDQVLMPFQDPVEMGMTLDTLVEAVDAQDFYPPLFEAAFGDSEISSDRISKALAQFVRSLVSFTSKYDEGRAQVDSREDDFPNFSDEENLGKKFFTSLPNVPNGLGCVVCHTGEAMVAFEPTNNGLDIDSENDEGVGGTTGKSKHMGTFKVPSLRNVGVRAGFMHDGRFSSLAEVVDHYMDSVQPHPNLGVPLSMHDLNLGKTKRKALIAFLETMTDYDMIEDPKFSDPFE
jgi:cytochrome c peroxidase